MDFDNKIVEMNDMFTEHLIGQVHMSTDFVAFFFNSMLAGFYGKCTVNRF